MIDKNQSFEVIIVGGGMVGMTLAVALARENMHVAVVEKTAMPEQLESSFDGRVSAIAHGSRCLLDNIGVWQHIAEHEGTTVAEPILDIRVSDGNTPFFLHYDHHEVGAEPFGYIVENRHIRYGLHKAAGAYPNLTIIERAAITAMERDDLGATLHTSGGVLRCRLLIGADGKHSFIRKEAGIGTTEWKYKQTAIVCTIGHELSHHGLAQERFLPAGPFAVLPLTPSPLVGEGGARSVTGEGAQHRSSLVWVEPDDRVKLYLDLPEDEFTQEITERVGDYLGSIHVIGQRFSYPLSLMHAKSYIGHRVALIGDAAHAIHPIAGQGVNLGFRDVAVLAELIADAHKNGADIGGEALLAHYQRWRRFDNITMIAVTDGLNRLFDIDLLPVKLARGLGMWAVGKLPPLKRFFMQDAMGITGDVPVLLKKK